MGRLLSAVGSRYLDFGRVIQSEGIAKLSWCLWMKKVANNSTIFAGKFNPATGDGFFTNYYTTGVYNSGVRRLVGGQYSTFNYSSTNWHHFAHVFDGTQPTDATKYKVYIDGVPQVLGFPAPGFPPLTSTDANSFRLGTQTTVYSDGYTANLHIYPYALTQGQVMSDMNGYIPVPPILYTWLGLSSPEADWSGYGNTGTLVNAPTVSDHCPAGVRAYGFTKSKTGAPAPGTRPALYFRNRTTFDIDRRHPMDDDILTRRVKRPMEVPV